MNESLSIAIIFLSVGILLFILGRMRIVNDKFCIPLFLSSFIFAGRYGITFFHKFVLPLLGFSEKTNDLLFTDYGLGLLGLLPLALAMLLIGKYVLKMNYNEQWGGIVKFKLPSLTYGIIAGLLISVVPLTIAALKGHKFEYKIDFYSYGINCVTNLLMLRHLSSGWFNFDYADHT